MDLLHFIETPIFQRKIDGLLSADEYQKFQEFLSLDATVGDTIAGTGGCRKVRWMLPGIGKSAGVRVIYYYLTRDSEIYLLIAYPKNEKDNLTNSEKNQLKKVIVAIEGAK
ncbi:type II toxin-antitoxin system RelE/ParE family toxin [Acerihabitans sp. TG2]|uniref:type II toxin-antitoxin system RelE/ParE family toxin n=1 Tax=Acerihabitans sp. TG2 TaxID=3096008 RepID=UPI002B23883A|nr:type II toxin-antitoxin system RelE/ParE family toxin [Acerihabitans sp. TG2]MEA9390727.1 type II toxin-antitoxin system RelE/ParE family toxin [Acerihabitans sp. TG2]